ncbi:MAG TPA: TlpA family protein disulfide reductase [Gammaproteobacteria bacterium]|nr:TlpA family protein disulfide reductase [Gammaproteobacteria bacterium]
MPQTASRLLLGLLLLCGLAGSVAAAEDFTLPDLDGREHRLSDYRGRWVLVNYWATWCPPCREELPELDSLYESDKDRVVVLGVNMEAISRERLREFVEEQFLTFPILVAGPQPRREQLLGPITGLPTSYLITPEGKMVARQVGPLTADAIRAFIDRYEKRQQAKGG